MTYEQITTLLEKGFTPEMIMTISGSGTASAATPPAADDKAGSDPSGKGDPPNGGEGGEAPPSPTPEGQPKTVPEDRPKTVPALDDVLKEMKELKASIQANNIKTQSVDTLKQGDSVEDVLASIIRPPMTNKEGK